MAVTSGFYQTVGCTEIRVMQRMESVSYAVVYSLDHVDKFTIVRAQALQVL
jgi:hypothetical protein